MGKNVVITHTKAIICYDLGSQTYRICYQLNKTIFAEETRQFDSRREFLIEVKGVLTKRNSRATDRLYGKFLDGINDEIWEKDRKGYRRCMIEVNVRSPFIDRK